MLIISRTCCLLVLLGLAACGGTKVLKEPKSLVITEPLASNADQHLSATLDWVIFRDGPGTWAKNVDWDEYMFRVRYLGADSVQLTSIVVMDSLGTAIVPRTSRRQLVKGTKETKRRYKGEGLRVKAGVSGAVLVGAAGLRCCRKLGSWGCSGGGRWRSSRSGRCGCTGAGAGSWWHRSWRQQQQGQRRD